MSQPVQDYVPRIPEMNKTQRELVQAEIETMLMKGAISQINHTQGERVYKLAAPCGEKEWRSASSDKFEESKFLRVLRALRNDSLQFLLKKGDYIPR